MKKRIISLLLAVCILSTMLAALPVTASAETSGIYTYTVANGEATITGCDTSASGAIEIPSSLGGYPVTTIGSYSFSSCYSLTGITIPDSVTSIEVQAFEYCSGLTSITIPDSVTSIGYCAFSFCNNLTSITIPDSVTSIGIGAFFGCERLTGITILDSVTTIGDHTFSDCYSLTSVTIPNSVTSIGAEAFYYCYSLTNITLPNSITTIEDNTFRGSGLTSIAIPDSVTSVGEGAFFACSDLTSVTIPDSVTSIGFAAFAACSNLTNVYYTGSEADWNGIVIGSDNDYLTDANIRFGKEGAVSKTCIDALRPADNKSGLSPVLDLQMYFNTSVRIGSGRVQIKDHKTDKTVKTFDISECTHEAGSNMISFTEVALEAGKTYYVTMDSGAVIGADGAPFYGIQEKDIWNFSTARDKALQKTTYVGLEYEKEGNLWWKTDNTELPPIPKGSDSDYMWELSSWAQQYGASDVYAESFDPDTLNMPVKLPVTDVNGQTFLLNDEGTTVKQVMQDIIFLEHLQPYVAKLDKLLADASMGSDGAMSLTQYAEEREAYLLAEGYAVRLSEYLDSRYGKEKSSFFLSVAAPLAYTTLLNAVTDGMGNMESQFVRTIADATVKENALQSHIRSISGTKDYETYKQGLSDVKNYVKLGKELYKIGTGGVSKSTAKLGADMLDMYFSSSSNEALNMISEAWSEFSSAKSAVQMCMFLGNSLGFFPYVVDLHTKLSKMLSDTVKAWYFIGDYYVAEAYPEIADRVLNDEYLLDSNYSYDWDVANYGAPDDALAHNWMYETKLTRAALLNTENIIGTRRDMANAANLFRFTAAADADEVKKMLVSYISAELNKGKTTEVYGMCPITIKVYDRDNNLMATLSSEDENDIHTEYGSFYLLGDDKDTKYFILSSDEYRMEILPYEEGEMSVAITQRDEKGAVLETTYYENVTIQKDEVYSADLSLDKPILTKLDAALEENTADAESIVIQAPAEELACGSSLRLTAVIYPDYAKDASVEWSVDGEAAEIDQDGCLTGAADGSVTVTAATANGVTASKEITVYTPVSAIKSEVLELPMMVGEEYTIEVTLSPEAAVQRPVKWTSSDTAVAAVDEGGTVTAKAAGEVIVTAAADGAAKEFYITVSEDILDIRLNQSDLEGDRIKLNMQNMSSMEDIDREIYLAIYCEGRLISLQQYPVVLAKQQKLTDYIDVALNGKSYEVKAFVWSEDIEPLQDTKSIPLISSIE